MAIFVTGGQERAMKSLWCHPSIRMQSLPFKKNQNHYIGSMKPANRLITLEQYTINQQNQAFTIIGFTFGLTQK